MQTKSASRFKHLLTAIILGIALMIPMTLFATQQAHAENIWVCNIQTADGIKAETKYEAMHTNLNSNAYTIYPSGDKSGKLDFYAIHNAMNKVTTYNQKWDHRNKHMTIRLIPGKTYYINQTLKLFDNVTFVGAGATLKQVTKGKGIFINALYKDSSDNTGSKKKIGGYNRCKNITITGGKYVTTGKPGSTTRSKNGWRFGYSTFLFMHGNNIKVSGVTIANNYNGHWIELAGCKNARIQNCNFSGSYKGDSTNEVIQLDTTKNSSCSPQGAPWDGTTTKSVTIDHCNFNVPTIQKAIGTNSMSKKKYTGIKVTNNTFKVKKYAVAFYKVSSSTVKNNTYKKGKVLLKSSKATLGKVDKKHKTKK